MTVKFYRLFNLFSTLRHAFKSYSLTVLFTKGLVAKNNFIADKITFENSNEGLKPYLKIRKKKKKKSDKSESDRVYQKVVCKREISTGLKLFLISLSNPHLCSSRVKGVHSCYVMFWIGTSPFLTNAVTRFMSQKCYSTTTGHPTASCAQHAVFHVLSDDMS